MNKRFLLPVLSTALLAPAFLAGQVYAEENTSSSETTEVVSTTEMPVTTVTSEVSYKSIDTIRRANISKRRNRYCYFAY